MADNASNNGTGRVTMKDIYDLVEKRDERILRRLDDLADKCSNFPMLVKMIEANSANIAEHEGDIKGINQEIKELNKRSNVFDGINALGVAIVGALGAWFGGK